MVVLLLLVLFLTKDLPTTGIININGPSWKEHRRFTLSTLRDFGMGKSKLEGKIHEEAALLVAEIDAQNGEPFDPKVFIGTHVANIICSMSFGMNFKHDDPRFLDMLKRFDENVRCVKHTTLILFQGITISFKYIM